jgi:hypothetical protein
MKATNSLKVKSVLAVFLAAAQLVIVSADVLAAQALDTATTLPDGIYLGDTMTQDDAAYLAASLEYLHTQLPQWWEYVMEARPFTLSFDPAMAANGRAAIASCCDEQGNGRVAFGYHPGQLTLTDDPASETVEARRATFLGTLVHELTHVRDQREGRFTAKTDRKSCVAAESSGLTKQLEVKRDLADKLASDPTADAAFRSWLDQQVKTEATDLRSRELWDWYCGAFED